MKKEKIRCEGCGWLIVPDDGCCPECGCIIGDDLMSVDTDSTVDSDLGL